MRYPSILPGLLIVLSLEVGAQSSGVQPGVTVRLSTLPIATANVQAPSTQVVGVFERFRSDTIYLSVPGNPGPPQYYAARNVMSLELSVGQRHPYVKGALFGSALGTAVGYAVGRITKPGKRCETLLTSGQTFCQPPDPTKTAYKSALPVGASLGFVGGLYVARKTLRHVWEQVPVSALR